MFIRTFSFYLDVDVVVYVADFGLLSYAGVVVLLVPCWCLFESLFGLRNRLGASASIFALSLLVALHFRAFVSGLMVEVVWKARALMMRRLSIYVASSYMHKLEGPYNVPNHASDGKYIQSAGRIVQLYFSTCPILWG